MSALFLPSPPVAVKPPRAIFTIRLPISPAFTVTFQNQTKVLPRTAPLHPLPHFQSDGILPVFVVCGGGSPPGISRPVKIRKHRLFAYHYGTFSENAFAGRNVALLCKNRLFLIPLYGIFKKPSRTISPSRRTKSRKYRPTPAGKQRKSGAKFQKRLDKVFFP